MSNPLIAELDATLNRIEIIKNNSSDKDTKSLANDCYMGLSQMTQQVKDILKLDNPEEK